MAEVRMQEVVKNFGDTIAVDHIDFSVNDGEFFVLLGPTGAGKTTTLRLIAGLERPDAGTVHIADRDVTAAAPAERDTAFVFQNFSLYPHFTVYENMAFPLRSPRHRWPEDEIGKRVREIAQLLRLDDKLDNRATRLSGGEMQRVAIGRALVREPSVYLMDEPLSSLDAKLREELRVELKRIQRELGATIIYVTHDHLEAMTLGDRLGVLSEGRIVQTGSPRDIYARPDSVYVASRLGSPRVNLLPPALLDLEETPAHAATIGIRPEDIELGTGNSIAHTIGVEHLGAETVVLLKLGDHDIRVLASNNRGPEGGSEVSLRVRPGTALFFDAEGRRIDTERIGDALP